MNNNKYKIIIIIYLVCAPLVWGQDNINPDERLVPAGNEKQLSESEAAKKLADQPLDKSDKFLLGLDLFNREKARAQRAGALEVNTPHLYTSGGYTKKAVLLIHGFTASPWEMSDLGGFLKKRGINAYAMRLAGHGTKPEDLLNIKWGDWYKSVEKGLELTGYLGEEVCVIGVSTGGVLAVKLAAEHSGEIQGIAVLAPAIFLQDWRSSFTGIGKYFLKYSVRPLEGKYKAYYYEKRSVSAIWELVKLSRHVRKIAGKVDIPILIIQSRGDQTVKPKGAEYLYRQVQSSEDNKKLVWLDNDRHVLTTDENPLQSLVFQYVGSFLD